MNKHVVTLSDTSHPYTTYTDESPKWEQSWHNDPKHNVEPETGTSREFPLSLAEYNKAGKTARELRFQQESDKRVERFFIVPQGLIWVLYHITDMPEKYEDEDRRWPWISKIPAKDGTTTLITASAYMSLQKVYEYINSAKADNEHIARLEGKEPISYTYDMAQM